MAQHARLTLSQVLVGFLVPPFLTLLLCAIQFLLDKETSSKVDMSVKCLIIPRPPSSQPSSETDSSSGSRQSDDSAEQWIAAIEGAILAFCDQQVVTGISILISGFSQLNTGLSSYHWQSVVNLAWLSSVTHLITLTSLRRQARENISFRWWRIIAMSIMAAMLMGALVPIGYLTVVNSNIPYSFPAWCLYHPGLQWSDYYYNGGSLSGRSGHDYTAVTTYSPDIYPFYNSFYMMLAVVILAWSYLSRMWSLFPSHAWLMRLSPSFNISLIESQGIHVSGPTDYLPFNFYIGVVEAGLSRLEDIDPQNKGSKILGWILYSIIRSGYTVLLSGYHLFSSRLWEVCSLFSIK